MSVYDLVEPFLPLLVPTAILFITALACSACGPRDPY